MTTNSNKILIAYSNSSHGIRGELGIKLINDESQTIKTGISVYVKSKNNLIEYEVENIRYGNKVILKLKGIETKTQSDELLPIEIYVEKSILPELGEDEYYINDLIGAKVIEFETGILLGELVDYYQNKIQTIIQVKTQQKMVDVIFNKVFIKNVDLIKKEITIVLPVEIE